MNAEVITVGTELLLGQVLDTNSKYLSEKLAQLGINLFYKTTVGDNTERLKKSLEIASMRAELIFVTGGLGPTVDDITRQAVAEFAGKELVINDKVFERIDNYFKNRNIEMPAGNKIQAYIPDGAVLLENRNGTAPGFIIKHNSATIIVMPGVPAEMHEMFSVAVVPHLTAQTGNIQMIIKSKVLKIAGNSESLINEKIKEMFETLENPSLAILASPVEVKIRITVRSESEEKCDELIKGVSDRIYALVGDDIYGEDDETLENVIAEELFSKQLTVSTAESCTSGLISHRLTNIEGSSRYYVGGVNTYSNRLKQQLLDVPEDVISQHGAVSEQCAKAMVLGCAEKFDTDTAISVTGIAGPGGGSIDKPVGLVFIGLLVKGEIKVIKKLFSGNRNIVRAQAAQIAMFEYYKMIKRSE